MILENKTDIKIFLTFFVLYSYFMLWSGMGESSRFSIVKSLVNDKTLSIDNYYNRTTDRSFYNGHYYSDKAPGGSFLVIPSYTTWKFIYDTTFTENFKQKYGGSNQFVVVQTINGNDIIDIVNPGFFELISMILVIVFTSSLFSALTVLLVYKISRYFVKKESHRILLAVIFGAGTLAFHYGLVFLGYSLEMFFGFLSFYLLFKMKKEKKYDLKYFLISGIFSGYAITSGYPSVIISMACLFYTLSMKIKESRFFIIGLIIGLLPLLIYNFSITSNPLKLTLFYEDTSVLPPESKEMISKNMYFSYIPKPMVILQLILLPYIGMFFYYPILILSILGFFYMYREYKIETLFIAFSLITLLLLFSSFIDWWHGGHFGFRHLLSIYPFLILPLSYCLKYRNKFLLIILIILSGISIFHNSIGLVGSYSDILRLRGILEKKYLDDVNKGVVSENPLYRFYLPLFIQNGPRSKIFENLVNGKIDIDIRQKPYSKGEFFPLFNDFHIPFLSLLPISIFLTLLWTKNVKIMLWVLFIFSVVILLMMSRDNANIGNGWYPKSPNEDYIWIYPKTNGTIVIPNNLSKRRVDFSVTLFSYNKERDVLIYLNNEIIDNFTINNKYNFEYSWLFDINSGKNEVKIFSPSCDYPYIINQKNDDERCLSIAMSSFSFFEASKNFVFSKNWFLRKDYPVKWMYNNGSIKFTSDSVRNASISFIIRSFNKSRTIDLYLNSKIIKTLEIPQNDINVSFDIETISGENNLIFFSKQECTKIGDVIGNDDIRCVTIGITDFELTYR